MPEDFEVKDFNFKTEMCRGSRNHFRQRESHVGMKNLFFFCKQQEGNPGKIMSNGGRARWQYETRKVDWGQIIATS